MPICREESNVPVAWKLECVDCRAELVYFLAKAITTDDCADILLLQAKVQEAEAKAERFFVSFHQFFHPDCPGIFTTLLDQKQINPH